VAKKSYMPAAMKTKAIQGISEKARVLSIGMNE
jgi:hypothetical protein